MVKLLHERQKSSQHARHVAKRNKVHLARIDTNGHFGVGTSCFDQRRLVHKFKQRLISLDHKVVFW